MQIVLNYHLLVTDTEFKQFDNIMIITFNTELYQGLPIIYYNLILLFVQPLTLHSFRNYFS